MKKILVVDDQKNVRASIRIGLGRVGYQVDVASNAENALLKLKEKPFDVVLADVRMPDTNGYVLANIIRQLYPDVKIILMSAYDFNEYDQKYQPSQPLPKLAKPFGMAELLSLLRRNPLSFQQDALRN